MLQVAGDICELFKLCSTKQLEAAQQFISKLDKSSVKKHGRHGDTCDGHKKNSVTMAMEQLSVSDNDSSTINNEHCSSDGHHSNSDSKQSTEAVLTTVDDNEGWEIVKRKKR